MIRAIRQKIPLSDSVLLRLVILAALTVGLVGVGYAATRISPPLIFIAAAALPIVLLVSDRPEYGVVGIVFTAAFVRFSLSTGTQSRIVASLLATMAFVTLWLARMFVTDRRLHLKPSSANVPLLAFIATAVVSYAWSNIFRDPLVVVWDTWPFVQLAALAVMILLPAAFLFTANVISQLRWLKVLCWFVIVVGTVALAARFLGVRLGFLNTGGLFSLWFVSLAYGQALLNKKLPLWVRLILYGLVGTWLYIYFIRQVTWLTGWLPPLTALAAISFSRSKRLFLIILLLIAVYVGLNWDYYAGTVLTTEANVSGYTRLDAWEHSWRVTKNHFLFGTGPAGYAVYYMSYFPREAMATHSNYIDILAQSGIVGLFFCLWLFGAMGWTGYRLFRRLRGSGDFSAGYAGAALGGWVGCVVAMGLGDWVFPFVYTQTIAGFDYAIYSWILLGGMAALDRLYPGESSR
jgi:hypothetical protein